MTLVRSPQTLATIREHYTALSNGEKKVLVSYFIRPAQKQLIDDLAAQNGMGKGEVVRQMIDEWCAMQLEKAEESG